MSLFNKLFSKQISPTINILIIIMKEKYTDSDKIETIKLFLPILNCTYTELNLILEQLNPYGDSKGLALEVLFPKISEYLTHDQSIELIINHKNRYGSNLSMFKLLESNIKSLDLKTVNSMKLDDETLTYVLSKKGVICKEQKEIAPYIACQLFHVTDKKLTTLFLNYCVSNDIINLALEKRRQKEKDIKKFILEHSEDDGDSFTIKYTENDKAISDMVKEIQRRCIFTSSSFTGINDKITLKLSGRKNN